MAGQNQNNTSQNNSTNNGIAPIDQNEESNVAAEYDNLDSTLDELNSALDFLENKNDNIQDQLKELLKSNIEIRQEMQNQNDVAETSVNQ